MSLQGLQLGRYRLLNVLGSGGMGEVYLAEDLHIRRQVALKVVRSEAAYPNSQGTGESERLFRREVRAIATLDHPYILPLFDYGEETVDEMTYTYMVMPLRREGSLANWLRLRGYAVQLTPEQVARLVHQAAAALQYAHQNQIIHQDVKPSNFLLRNNEEHPDLPDLLLADFGIARFHTATASMSQTSRGTPTYMAPEQWSGEPQPASDQYALAIMTYQLLTGHPPFEGRQEQVMYQHFNTVPKPPSSLNPAIPVAIDEVLLRALAKKPEERYPTISAFSAALQSVLRDATVLPAQPAPPAPITPSANPSTDHSPTPSPEHILRATLAINEAEASSGTTRTLTLPGGKKVAVNVPAHVADGYTINLPGTQPGETLAVTIAIKRAEEESIPVAHSSDKTYLSAVPPTQAAVSSPASTTGHPPMQRFKALPQGRKILLIGLAIVVFLATISLGTSYFTGTNFIQRTVLLSASLPNPYPPHTGQLALNDPLVDNSNGYSWGTGTTPNGYCTFANSALHAMATKQSTYYTCSPQPTFSDFAFEVRMTILRGDYGGVEFRSIVSSANFYSFRIRQDGAYDLRAYTSVDGSFQPLSTAHSNIPSFNKGLGKSNIIAVVANGDQITLYVNNAQVASVTDNTYSQGQIGVFADDEGNATEVAFNDARVWAL